jgi:hypothetical protein
MSWARPTRIALALALLGLAGGGATAESEKARQAWTEIDWPFLLDQWGTGRAFRCEGPGCGAERLFVRVKSGFCNCFQGVADDDEVDRLTDFEFLDGRAQPLGTGRPIRIADRSGRMRSFAVATPDGATRQAVSAVVSKDCEALVATLILSPDGPVSIEPSLLLPGTMIANLP